MTNAVTNGRKTVPARSTMDITSRFRNARLRASGGGSEAAVSLPDAFSERVKDFKQNMQLTKLQEIETRQIEADVEAQTGIAEVAKLEAEVKSLELKQRLQELRDAQGGGTNSPQNAMMMMMFEQLMASRTKERDEPSPIETAMMHIMQELADIRKESLSPKESKPPMEKLSEDLQMLISLRALMAEMAPAAPVSRVSDATHDLETTIAMKRLELDHEHKLMEIELTKDRYRAELQLREKEVAAEERKANGFAQGLGSLAEAIKPVAAELMQQFQNRPPAIPQTPVQTMPMPVHPAGPVGMALPSPPPEVLEPMICNDCGTPVPYPSDHSIGEATCPNIQCGATYIIDWNG